MSLVDAIKNTSVLTLETSEKYLDKTKEYYKLTAFSYFSSFTSDIVKVLLISFALFLSGIFFSVAIFISLAELFDNYIIASASMGIIYLIVALLIFLIRGRIENYVIRKISKRINEHENL